MNRILVVVAVLVAAIWGYAKDDFRSSEPETEEAPPAKKQSPPPEVAEPEEIVSTDTPPPAVAQPRPQQAKVPVTPPPSPGSNAYLDFMRSQKNSMDSITPGAIKESQKARRNAYFEKLSKQLKELKGDQPTNENVPANTAANPPQANINPEAPARRLPKPRSRPEPDPPGVEPGEELIEDLRDPEIDEMLAIEEEAELANEEFEDDILIDEVEELLEEEGL